MHFSDQNKFYIVFIKENDEKIKIFEKIFLTINRCILTFSLEETLDLAQILLIRPKFARKMQKFRSKYSTQNPKKIAKIKMFLIFFFTILYLKKNILSIEMQDLIVRCSKLKEYSKNSSIQKRTSRPLYLFFSVLNNIRAFLVKETDYEKNLKNLNIFRIFSVSGGVSF